MNTTPKQPRQFYIQLNLRENRPYIVQELIKGRLCSWENGFYTQDNAYDAIRAVSKSAVIHTN